MSRNAGDVLGHREPDLVGDGSALEQSCAARGRRGHAPSAGAIGLAGLAAPDRLPGVRGQPLHLVQQRVDAGRSSRPRSSGSPTDGRLISTLAAAPRAAASARSDATARSLDAFTLLRPASASETSTRSRQASTQDSGISDASRAAAWSAADARGLLLVGVAGELHRRREAGVGAGVVVGERQEAVDQGGPGGVGPGEEVGVLLVARPAGGQGRDHRDEPGPETGRDRRRAAAAGDGLGRGEGPDEAVERQVAKAGSAGRHRAIVGGTATGGRPRTEGRRDRTGGSRRDGHRNGAGAVPARPPRGRRCRRAGEGSDSGATEGDGWRPQAARRSRSKPVTVHRRDRWWKVRERRAPGVSTSKNVRGPVTTG